MTNKELIERLNWRYATKAFDPAKKVSEADWATLEQALILSPSSFGLQPYKFVVVTDSELKEKLKPAANGQSQITDSSHLVVVTYKKSFTDQDIEDFIDLNSAVRGTPRENLKGLENSIKNSVKKKKDEGSLETWTSRQAYIALGFLLQAAAVLEIDACPMEGFDPAKFNRILELEDYSAVALCAVGYRKAEKDWLAPLAKVRSPKEHLIDRR